MKYLFVTCLFFFLILALHTGFAQGSFTDTDFSDPAKWDSAGTFAVDFTSSPGELILLTGEHENLALRRKATIYPNFYVYDTSLVNPSKLIDGNPSTFVEIRPGGDGTVVRIDLQALRRVSKVVMKSLGGFTSFRPRAYTIYTGVDSLHYSRVVQRIMNLDSVTTDVFDPVVGRFMWIVFDVVDRGTSTVLSEIEVYGKGYLSNGTWTSSVRDVKALVNWGTVIFHASLPAGTHINFQFRTGSSPKVDSTWSKWSDSVTVNNALFDVFEPRRYIQYRINLLTDSLETPRLQDVTVNYDTRLVAQSTMARVQPALSPILREAELSYLIRANFDTASLGIDTVVIDTPTPTTLISVLINDVAMTNYKSVVTADRITIGFPTTITSSSDIVVKLRAKPYLERNRFPSWIISSKAPGNPQRADSPSSNDIEAWTLVTTDVPERLLVDVAAVPNPFTPNGDGINDKTRFNFFLSNLNVARPLTIKIYDMTGRLVRNLLDANSIASAYVLGNAIEWDGRDNDGKIVRPGIYIYQINVGSDASGYGEVVSKTVVVAY